MEIEIQGVGIKEYSFFLNNHNGQHPKYNST
jgi:hypothetical protein